MKLYQFNDWYQLAVNYWSDPNHTDCPDACIDRLNHLKNIVDNYRNHKGDSYIWFKRCIPAMLNMKVAKDHTRFNDPNVPDVSVNTLTFTSLLGAFILDLPEIETLFSTYESQQPCDTECGDSISDSSDTITYTCLDTSRIDSLENQIQQLPKSDLNRIMNFIESIDTIDRSLYLMFKGSNIEIIVDNFTMKDIAIECQLDQVLKFYNWYIPGFE